MNEDYLMKKIICIFCAISMAVWLASPAAADLALDFTSVPEANNQTHGSYSLGFQFQTNVEIVVTALGFYDYQKDGLTEDHDVGIYDSVGNLLVSTKVLTTDPLISFFRFRDVAPTTLPADQRYYIMAVTGSEKYAFEANGLTVDPAITYATDSWYWDFNLIPSVPQQTRNLMFPNGGTGITQNGGGGYFGPNFLSQAPLPSSLLLVGSGLFSLIGLGRRRRQ
jgi:hypothetical protein